MIGRRWEGRRGGREVVGQQELRGEMHWLVRDDGSRFAHFIHPDDLEKEIAEDAARAKAAKEAEIRDAQKARKEAQEKQERSNLHGFEKRFSGVQLQRVLKTLDRQLGVSGVYLPRRDHVERLVAQGYFVRPSKKYGRLLEGPDGGAYYEKDFTKTAFDYADYLNQIGFKGRKKAPEVIQEKARFIDVTDHPTLIEYGVREMMKGKGPGAAASATKRKLHGSPNMLLGAPADPVSIDEDRLSVHLFDRIVSQARENIDRFKPGARDIAIGAAVDGFKQGKRVEARVRKALAGYDPHASEVDAVMMEAFGFGSDT